MRSSLQYELEYEHTHKVRSPSSLICKNTISLGGGIHDDLTIHRPERPLDIATCIQYTPSWDTTRAKIKEVISDKIIFGTEGALKIHAGHLPDRAVAQGPRDRR